MKVLMLNGSPHKNGCTDRALREIAAELAKAGVDSEIFWLGAKPAGGCVGCGACGKTGKCAFDGGVNEFVEKAREADGFIFGSPVHYAAASGSITGFLDRAFYSGSPAFQGKPGAAVVSARRAGTTAAFDQLNKYFTISSMPIATSQYWNQIHGSCAEDAMQDAEGLQTMRTLARNMVFLMRSIALGKEKYGLPEKEEPKRTNFIR